MPPSLDPGDFAPNHVGMPIVPPDMKIDFLRRQVLMSRNITGGELTSFAMGGLNYQIEHHLFPNMLKYLAGHSPHVRSTSTRAQSPSGVEVPFFCEVTNKIAANQVANGVQVQRPIDRSSRV